MASIALGTQSSFDGSTLGDNLSKDAHLHLKAHIRPQLNKIYCVANIQQKWFLFNSKTFATVESFTQNVRRTFSSKKFLLTLHDKKLKLAH